jgi:hypothetical protein
MEKEVIEAYSKVPDLFYGKTAENHETSVTMKLLLAEIRNRITSDADHKR